MRWLWAWLVRIRRSQHLGNQVAAPAATEDPGNTVAHGDRGITLVSRAHSLQARINALLAGGLAVGILAGMLVWYYAEALPRAGDHAAASHGVRAGPGGGAPPSLGTIPPPHLMVVAPAVRPVHAAAEIGPRAGPSRPVGVHLARLAPSALPSWRQRGPASMRDGLHRPKAARRYSGAVFIGRRAGAAHGDSGPERLAVRRHRFAAETHSGGRLRTLLRPSVAVAVRAQLLPQRRLLLAKGTFIDCTLETAIDSTLPGMTTCITSTDTFSADGTVVLLPRGTQLIGQTRGAVRRGMTRVFVIWTQARTPSGVIVQLDSPATDSLGRSGLTGTVDRHFWERFGAALLVSTLSGVIQSSVDRPGGTVIIDPTAGEDVLTQTLRGTEDIAPTIEVPNGQRIEVLVARDVDFRSVYELVAR